MRHCVLELIVAHDTYNALFPAYHIVVAVLGCMDLSNSVQQGNLCGQVAYPSAFRIMNSGPQAR